MVLEGGSARRCPATINRHLSAVFSFYDYHARNGVGLAQALVAWRRSNRGGYKPFLHHVTAGRPTATRPLRLRTPRRLPRTLTTDEVLTLVEACDHLRDRFLLVLLAETGMRIGQALGLRHCDFVSHRRELRIVPRSDNVNGARAKTNEVTTIPISAGLVRLCAQQLRVERSCPEGSPWLFPARSDPRLPQSYDSFRVAFAAWQARIDLHDEAGRSVRVTPHRLRHTLGTRLVNQGVPQHVIQRLLGHASPEMTAVYARLHDTTIRKEFERYCQSRVDVDGRLLGFDPEALTADAEWVKHNLARAADTLPNGYCGRPPQQDCPYPNACLTCPDFQTTVQFLPVHRQQAQMTRDLIAAAEAAGRQRLADNHRKVLISLDKIVASLEALPAKGDNDA